ncbi:hypothetical protein E2C01_071671 [Portunus trituberculatus]|uniref:Secreted protein n=1 Tax=Portunus trituberculatus TaxID=210409 RepID=A0A5B7I4I7_PORTR|nr:hypothetical protein [Portunus trituberculatus]
MSLLLVVVVVVVVHASVSSFACESSLTALSVHVCVPGRGWVQTKGTFDSSTYIRPPLLLSFPLGALCWYPVFPSYLHHPPFILQHAPPPSDNGICKWFYIFTDF